MRGGHCDRSILLLKPKPGAPKGAPVLFLRSYRIMHFPLSAPRWFRPGTALLVALTMSAFAGCGTKDPKPGQGSGGSSSTGGRSPGKGSGGVDFGADGGAGGDSGLGGDGQVDGSGGRKGPGGTGGSGATDSGRNCGERPVSNEEFTKKRLLESAGACSAYSACVFSSAAFELGRQVTRYADSPSDARLEAARAAWLDAALVWSETAPSQFGPIASTASDRYHGRGIGSFIHAWPALNRCEIEKQVATRAYEEQGFQRILPSARGLAALEYLLFYEGDDTVCASNSTTYKVWAELSEEEIDQAKRDYARAVVGDLYEKSQELVSVWDKDGEDFGKKLSNYEGYGSEQEALNVVAWSLLYPYDSIRDLKIGPLVGIGTALKNPESPYAEIDTESIRANLAAFRALFQGCGEGGEGIGFDDWLTAAGADDLRQEIQDAFDTIDAHAAELPPLDEASDAELNDFYAELKVLSDLLKQQFFGSGSVLNLKLPASAASDTD